MTIPNYQELMRPVLDVGKDGPIKVADAVEKLGVQLQLPEEELREMLPSGRQAVFANRVHWAKTYLAQAGLVRGAKRGWFETTELGLAILADASIDVNTKYLERFDSFQEFRARSRPTADNENQESQTTASTMDSESATPDENLLRAHRRLQDELAISLLEAVRSASPSFFEQLIVDLLLAMGYGGSEEDAGRAIGRSGDNGVDGVIDQDPLGVDQVYLQAKRYAEGNTVSSGELRDFFGALSLRRATKGIFFTTSSFSPSALDTAKNLGSRIVLIDGQHLARLMIRYGVGCRETNVLRIREVDESYFDEA